MDKLNKIVKIIIEFKWMFIILIATFAVIVIISNVHSCTKNQENEKEGGDTTIIVIDTISSISVQRIESKGDVYVLSGELEEMSVREYKKYKCVQTVKQKCVYKFSLNDVEYCRVPDSATIYVRMPQMQFNASNISTRFMPNDTKFWEQFNNDNMKKECEIKIKKIFCTKTNEELAIGNAENIVRNMLNQLGYEVRFVDYDIKRYEKPVTYQERPKTIKKSELEGKAQ